MRQDRGRVTAVLGPTNTGKTHYAIQRMLDHRTGVIGLPLRLLAREVYDRIVALRGPSVVALVTGEERIVPERTQYWVCTVEAMPLEIGADFVAVDEIQLCGDPDRGHVFTDRLLRARGLLDTMFLGSDVMRPAIAALVPGVTFLRRERLSTLTWTGPKKISRMPPRSAIVGFSVEEVYAIAELIRRQKGGCAVVMGALSPRTRNAQVALYQNGDVDYLVATDAIGMGLNLDIKHVAFSGTYKFDGRRMRPLFPHEMGQIAGRAGRFMENGTFGVTGDASPVDEGVVDAIENHRFAPIQRLHWRNPSLEFSTVERLIASLEAPTDHEWLVRARESDDLMALKSLADLPELRDRLRSPQAVRLLWDVCRVPDFRGKSGGEHHGLLARIFGFIQGGKVPTDWMKAAVERIDKPSADIDTLSKRLAYIRTWTYVSQRSGWVEDESHWRDETRAVEDRLSDALHAALTQRFVDRRTSVLMRRLKQKETLVAEVNDKGEVTVEGEFAGRLEGFRFRQDASPTPDAARTLRQAAVQALAPEFHLRADRFYNAPDTEMDFTEQGGLMWGTTAVGKLTAGPEPMRPQVDPFVDEDAGPEVIDKVRRRLQHFIDRRIAAQFEPLMAMGRDETLTGLARGFAFRLVEALGVLTRDQVTEDVKALDQESRSALRKHGVRFGQFTVFLPQLLKPAPTRLRLVLWSLSQGLAEFPESPPPGMVTIPSLPDVPKTHYTLAGYHPAGTRAIRIDMLERLADLLRARDSRAGFEAVPEMLSITGLSLEQFAVLMGGLGYHAERGERPKVKPQTAKAAVAVDAAVAASDRAIDDIPDVGTEGDGASAAVAETTTVAADASVPEALAVETPDPDEAVGPAAEVSATEMVSEAETVAEPETVPEADVDPEPSVPEPSTADASLSQAVASAELNADTVEPVPTQLTEVEVFYTFTWAPRQRRPEQRNPRGDQANRRPNATRTVMIADEVPVAAASPDAPRTERASDRERRRPEGERGPRPQGKPQGGQRSGGKDRGSENRERSGGPREGGSSGGQSGRTYEARPPRDDRPIDPDNPFAALLALKGKI